MEADTLGHENEAVELDAVVLEAGLLQAREPNVEAAALLHVVVALELDEVVAGVDVKAAFEVVCGRTALEVDLLRVLLAQLLRLELVLHLLDGLPRELRVLLRAHETAAESEPLVIVVLFSLTKPNFFEHEWVVADVIFAFEN